MGMLACSQLIAESHRDRVKRVSGPEAALLTDNEENEDMELLSWQ